MARKVVVTRIGNPAARPFLVVTLAEAKAHCRVDIADDDALITSLIESATEYCERRTNKSLPVRQWSIEMSSFPYDGAEIVVPIAPLSSVSSVTYYDMNNAAVVMSAGLYRVGTNMECGRIRTAVGTTLWPYTASVGDAVTIVFDAGYATAALVPSGYKQAIKLLVGHWYENREAVSNDAGSAVDLAVDSLLNLLKTGTVAA